MANKQKYSKIMGMSQGLTELMRGCFNARILRDTESMLSQCRSFLESSSVKKSMDRIREILTEKKFDFEGSTLDQIKALMEKDKSLFGDSRFEIIELIDGIIENDKSEVSFTKGTNNTGYIVLKESDLDKILSREFNQNPINAALVALAFPLIEFAEDKKDEKPE